MASDKATTMLTSLPLEVRHAIFNYTAARQTKPKKLLRYWFEKKETKELVAKHAADNPNDPAPQVVYHQEQEVDSEPEPEPAAEEDEEDSENEDEDEDEDGQDNDNGEDQDEDAEVDDDEDDNVDVAGGEEDQEDDDTGENDGTHITGTGTSQTSTSVPTQSTPPQATSTTQAQTQTASVDQDDEAGPDAEDEPADQDNAATQDGDGDEAMSDESEDEEGDKDEEDTTDPPADAAASAPPQQPPAVVISPHHKWRHIPNFMRISHCPPPVELLLASKQLNQEAKNWFYDVAVLRISATSSFAHTSFFEEAFSQITEAAFSPMENIRKVEVLFVWDTTWLRAEETGCADAIFPALLRQRGDFVHRILSQAPDLREVTIHWHDSAQDNESANFMLDILAPFHTLNANVQIKEHYIAADAKPHKNSIAGQRRLEFQRIVDGGLDRLF